jgi:hypothetical protein
MKHNLTILIVHHLRKMASGYELDKLSGSSGMTGVADAILILERDGVTSKTAKLQVTGRDIESRDLQCVWDQEHVTWVVQQDMVAAVSGERQQVLDDIGSNGPSTSRQIADRLGKNHDSMRKLLKRMFADNLLVGTSHQYSLPAVKPI